MSKERDIAHSLRTSLTRIVQCIAMACAISACNGASNNGVSAATGGAVATPPVVGARPNGGGKEGPAPAACLAEGEAFTFGTKCCAGLQTQLAGLDIYCLAQIEDDDGEDGDGEDESGVGNGEGDSKKNGGPPASTRGPGPSTIGAGNNLTPGPGPDDPTQDENFESTTNSYYTYAPPLAIAAALAALDSKVQVTPIPEPNPIPREVYVGKYRSKLDPYGDPADYTDDGWSKDADVTTLTCPSTDADAGKTFVRGLLLKIDDDGNNISDIIGLQCGVATPDKQLHTYAFIVSVDGDEDFVPLSCPTDHVVVGWELRRMAEFQWYEYQYWFGDTSDPVHWDLFNVGPTADEIKADLEWRITNINLICRPISGVMIDDGDRGPFLPDVPPDVTVQLPYGKAFKNVWGAPKPADGISFRNRETCKAWQALYDSISVIRKSSLFEGAHIAAMAGTCAAIRSRPVEVRL